MALNGDDTPILGVTSALHETALGHAVDDAGHVGERHVEALRQATHGHGAFALEQVQHVKVRRADGTQAAVPGHRPALARDHRLELLEDLVDHVRGFALASVSVSVRSFVRYE